MKKVKSVPKLRLVVYTVLIGAKEELNDPLRIVGHDFPTDLAIDYVCLTDLQDMTSPTWRPVKLEHPLIPPERLSRLPKTQPDLFFPEYQYSLYIDNTVVFKRLPCKQDVLGAKFRAFRHPWRTNPLDEADIVVRSGLDDGKVVAEQLRFYASRSLLASVHSLTAGTVLLRAHNHPDVKKFGMLWWEQILLFSKRDQISLDLCAELAGCPVDHFLGDKRENDLFFWPALPTGRRVLGSFDDDRYAWEHRTDADAVLSPRKHFLASQGDSEEYSKYAPWFEYLCDRVGSGLGSVAPPRRDVAEIIGAYLPRLEKFSCKILLVGVSSQNTYSVGVTEELVRARTALDLYFRFGIPPAVVDVVMEDGAMNDQAPFRAAGGQSGFDLIVVLGLPNCFHDGALNKFADLLGSGGDLIIQFGESLLVDETTSMRRATKLTGKVDVFHGRHISRVGLLPSNVVVFSRDATDLHVGK